MKFEIANKGDNVLTTISVGQQVGFAFHHIGEYLVACEIVKVTPKYIDVKHPDRHQLVRHNRSDGSQHGGTTPRRSVQPYNAALDQTEAYQATLARIAKVRDLDYMLDNSIRLDFSKISMEDATDLIERINALPKRDQRL